MLASLSTAATLEFEPPLHLVLERKRLDHAQALQRFLHGLDDARAAGELHAGDVADPPRQLAQKEDRRWRGDEAGERHHWILGHHHDCQPDQRHQVAADGSDQKIDDRRYRSGAGGQPRDEFRGVAVGEEAHILVHELLEHPPLVVGDDTVADPRQHHRAEIGRQPLGGEDRHHRDAEQNNAAEIVTDIGFVGERADQVGGERGAGGGDHHHQRGERITRPMRQRFIDQQATHQRKCRIGVRRPGRGSCHALSVASPAAREAPSAGVPCPEGPEFSSNFHAPSQALGTCRRGALFVRFPGRIERVGAPFHQLALPGERMRDDGRQIVEARLPSTPLSHRR